MGISNGFSHSAWTLFHAKFLRLEASTKCILSVVGLSAEIMQSRDRDFSARAFPSGSGSSILCLWDERDVQFRFPVYLSSSSSQRNRGGSSLLSLGMRFAVRDAVRRGKGSVLKSSSKRSSCHLKLKNKTRRSACIIFSSEQ